MAQPEVLSMYIVRKTDGAVVEAAAQWNGMADELQRIREVGFELHAEEGHRTGRPLKVFHREPFREFVIPLGGWAVRVHDEEAWVVESDDLFWNIFQLLDV